MSFLKNIAPIIIIFLTIVLFWTIFSPEDEIMDPFKFLSSYGAFFVTVFLISVLVLFFIYRYRREFFLFLLVILKLLHLLNICNYCLTIRSDNHPYLVDGYCRSCNTHLCSKCFNFQDDSKKIGCPNCGSCVFITNKRLAYPFLPHVSQNIAPLIIIVLVIALFWVIISPEKLLVDHFEFLLVFGTLFITILIISVLSLSLIYHYRKQFKNLFHKMVSKH